MLKRCRLVTLLCLLLLHPLFSSPANQVQEYTLENGMQVFLLEDSSDAQVHIEFTCRAGFSSQTQSTNGFFKLYTRLIQAANPKLNFTEVLCNADSSRYIIEASPSQVNELLYNLSDAVFSPDFSDELLKNQLDQLKKEVNDNKDTMSVYINAAIDSRVFSAAPWKHDSGIYPPVFKKTSEKTARSVIRQISEQWYTPQNSAIFICGNINTERTLLMLRNSFGRFYSSFRTPQEKPAAPVNHQRKYVLHSNEISADLTQLVIQYTLLDMEESDLLALSLGYEGSLFKQQLLSFPELNIPGDEYINISSAHKKDSSRLIIQTLLQPPEAAEDKKQGSKSAETNSYKQTELFLQQLQLIPQLLHPQEFEYAKNQLEYSLERTAGLPSALMQTLSEFWALQPYNQNDEVDLDNYNSQTTRELMNRPQKLRAKELSQSLTQLQSEEPFIFVIINSKDYKANKKAYTAAGFEEINEKNASWYVQEIFKDSQKEAQTENTLKLYTTQSIADDNSYYQKNVDSMSSFTLSNGIKVYTKENPLSEQSSLILSIAGGKYNSADDNGFEEVMVNLTATLIQKKLRTAQAEGLLTGAFNVSSETDLSTGKIIIEFDVEDTIAVLKAIYQAIVYGEIAPADADRAVSARKYKKRLENGTAANQLYSEFIKKIENTESQAAAPLSAVFDAENEILLETDYTKILSAYPAMLNANRYSVIVCGAIHQALKSIMEESLGQLAPQSPVSQASQNFNPDFSAVKNLQVKIRHTFLTDIPAEKAGPQPAVLIPTTEFLDPVIYADKAPKQGTKEAALYNALLNYIGCQLEKTNPVTVQLPRKGLNFGTLIIQNVAHTRELDSQYKTIIQNTKDQLLRLQANKAVSDIKNLWIQKQMAQTSSNTGTALLMQKGLELFSTEEADLRTQWYLEEYNYIQNATVQDYLEILEYFPVIPQARIYSVDSKK